MPKELLTASEFHAATGGLVTLRAIERMCRAGGLQSTREGRTYQIPASEIDRFLRDYSKSGRRA